MKELRIELNEADFAVQRGGNDGVIRVGASTQQTEIGIDVLVDVFCIEKNLRVYSCIDLFVVVDPNKHGISIQTKK